MPRNPNCTLCPLGDVVRKSGGHVCIGADDDGWPWDGEQPIETGQVLVVGQNPGRDENREGVPFVGPTGKYVRPMLRESNFPFVLTNAVKCWAGLDGQGKDIEPSTESVNACRPYLLEEILTYRPSIIFALGNPALKAVSGRSGVFAYRGEPQTLRADLKAALIRAGWPEDEHPPVMCSVHPAYTLKVPNARGLLIEDITNVGRLYRRKVHGEPVPDAAWVDATFTDLAHSQPWAVDIEATTADYRSEDFRIYLIGVDDGSGPVKMLTDESDFRSVYLCIGAGDKTFSGLGFDAPALRWKYGRMDNEYIQVDDVMLLAYLVDETMPEISLQNCATRWLGVTPWKDAKPRTKVAKEAAAEEWRRGPQTPEEWTELKQYNARDTQFTRSLWDALWPKLTPGQQNLYRHLLLPASCSLQRIEETGVYVSRENLTQASIEQKAEIARTKAIITRIAEDHFMYDFNPNAARHIRKLLYNKLELTPPKYTDKTHEPSTDQESLKILAQQDKALEVCTALLDYKTASKLESSYLAKYPGMLDENSRLYPPYFLTRTETGRTSSWIQQIPRKHSVRRIIAAPSGRKIVIADQSQMELRHMAWRSRDPNMLAVYREGAYGGDLHRLVATRLIGMQARAKGLPEPAYDPELHKSERYLSKAVNFGTQYGAEAFTLQAYLFKEFGLKVTLTEAEFLRNDVFFGTFVTLPAFFNSVIAQVKKDKQITSAFGRIRHLPNIDASDIDLRAEAARQAINSPTQADASDITLIGLNLSLEAAPWLDPVMFGHDSNIFEVDEDRAEEAASIVHECMTTRTLAYMESYFHIDFDVPLVVDVEISQEWKGV